MRFSMRDLLLKLLKFRWPLHSLLIIIGFFNSSHPFSLEPWVSPLFVTPTLRIPAFCVRIHHGDFSATHHRNFSTNKHWSVFPFSRWVFYQSPAKYVLFLTEVSLVPKTTEVSSLLITVIFQPVTTNLNVSCAIFTTVIFIPITIPHQSHFTTTSFFFNNHNWNVFLFYHDDFSSSFHWNSFSFNHNDFSTNHYRNVFPSYQGDLSTDRHWNLFHFKHSDFSTNRHRNVFHFYDGDFPMCVFIIIGNDYPPLKVFPINHGNIFTNWHRNVFPFHWIDF